jgi:H+-translocating NAD(P) transhydrogenase subunit alpha
VTVGGLLLLLSLSRTRQPRGGRREEIAMLTFILPGSLAALNTQAAVGPVVRDSAQHVTPDIVLAQLDIIAAASGGAMHAATSAAVDPFVFRLSIFVLAIFVGYYVVWSVTPALHTPLMSVTNAISSVIVVGALLAVGVPLVANDAGPIWARAFGFIALVLASVNIFGGFLVTQRMLGMYQKKKK